MTAPQFLMFPDFTAAKAATGGLHRLRCPHHTASIVGLIGDLHRRCDKDRISLLIRPGECLLAEGGVLLLDDLPEFRREAVEAIARVWHRQVVRYAYSTPDSLINIEIPTCFDVFATTTSCPCGMDELCACTEGAKKRFDDRVQSFRLLFEEPSS
jgi:magnesium chelatase family protein